MKFLSMCKAVALTALLSIAALPAVAQSLTTAYNSGSSRAGITFDLTANEDVTVTSFDVNLGGVGETGTGAGQDATVEIYWRSGTATGFDGSADGWTLLGTTTVVSAGKDNPTHVPLGGLGLPAGQTHGIYINLVNFVLSTHTVRYTNIESPESVSNGTLTLDSGSGKDTPVFTGQAFTPRMFNGTVYYSLGIAPATTCASEGYTYTKLLWCQNICEKGYTGSTLAMWIRRWTDRYRTLPYCAIEEEAPPQET